MGSGGPALWCLDLCPGLSSQQPAGDARLVSVGTWRQPSSATLLGFPSVKRSLAGCWQVFKLNILGFWCQELQLFGKRISTSIRWFDSRIAKPVWRQACGEPAGPGNSGGGHCSRVTSDLRCFPFLCDMLFLEANARLDLNACR